MAYTFITTFRGGTYIEQVEAAGVLEVEATHIWAERIARKPEIEHLDASTFHQTFQVEIEEYPPAPIDGCPNVWFLFYFSGRNRMEVHIVKTAVEFEPARKRTEPAHHYA
ncbi:MAG: hypothetical protein AAB316_25295 [Bacteroidota bacterium]